MTAFFNYYETTVKREPFPRLLESVQTDVCIIGGGIAGMSTALELRKSGVSCVLLEAKLIGGCASGMNGGQVIRGFAPKLSAVEKVYGTDVTSELLKLAADGVDKIFSNITQHNISCEAMRGQLTVATNETHLAALEWEAEALLRTYGYTPVEILDRQELLPYVRSARYVGGLRDPRGGTINPLAYTLGIASTAASYGAKIFERSPVSCMKKNQGRWHISTSNGDVVAERVVLASNAFNGDLDQKVARNVLKLGTYQVATRQLGEHEQKLIGNDPIFDTHTFNHYFRKTQDHRLLFGCSVGTGQNPGKSDLKHITDEITKIFNNLKSIEIDYIWGGWLDITANQMPDIREVEDGRIVLQGFNGHGLNCATMAAALAAEKLNGVGSSFDLFSKIKHQSLPGLPWSRLPLAWAGQVKYYLASKLAGEY